MVTVDHDVTDVVMYIKLTGLLSQIIIDNFAPAPMHFLAIATSRDKLKSYI